MTPGRGRRAATGAAALALVLVLAGCGAGGAYGIAFVFEGAHELEGEHAAALVVVGGSAAVSEGAVIRSSVWVTGGSLTVAGAVEGDVSALGGTVRLHPGATVSGDLNVAGGTVTGLGQATIGGAVTERTGLELPFTPGWEREQTLTVQVGLALLRILVMSLAAAAFALVFPRPLRRVERAWTREPHVAVALGLLGVLVALPLIVFMAFTVVLIPVGIALLVLLGLGAAFGWAAAGAAAGRRLPGIGGRLAFPLAAGIGAGALVLAAEVLVLVPLVGGVLVGLAAAVGFGAVLLTRFGTRGLPA